MKLIIDIDDGHYKWIMEHASNHPLDYRDSSDLEFRKAIEHGTLLPKNHGDLIDRNKLHTNFVSIAEGTDFLEVYLLPVVDTADVVIPAERDNNNGMDN